jgi:D-cysteine desulfhydrase
MTKAVQWPPRLNLAFLPTPMHRLQRMAQRLGVDLWIKRDDMTGMALSGNKIRKLEFALADALAQKADVVLTCGGQQSNHARATAVAAARIGLRCRLILRTPDPLNPPPSSGNILLDRMAGAEIVWITPEEYRARAAIFARERQSLETQGLKVYTIPEGASYAPGAWGYIAAMAELKENIDRIGNLPTIVVAAGSGGTAAGLILGAKLLDLPVRIVCINVCDDADYFRRAIGDVCDAAIADYHLPVSIDRQHDIEIIDGYVGRGYALSRPEELALICDLARTEGLYLDPVYTGKAFYAMVSELEKRPGCFGDTILFLHTGGLFGLFPKADEIDALLNKQS